MSTRQLSTFSKFSCILLFLVVIGLLPSQASANVGGRFERTLGTSAVPEIVKLYGGEYIVSLQERLWLEEVFRRLVEVTERQDVEYSLTVLASKDPNAFALPGGYVFITQGLLKLVRANEAKLAAVLGHEIAHVERRHGVNAVLRQMGIAVLVEVGVMVLDMVSADLFRLATGTLLQLFQLGWGREAEYEADLLGQSIAVRAGFDGLGAVALLDDLKKIEEQEDIPMKIFRTHPDTEERRRRLEENLLKYWAKPVLVTDRDQLQNLNLGRNYAQDRRIDPNGRYGINFPTGKAGLGLEVFDHQLEQTVIWLGEAKVTEAAWSPDGQYLAAVVDKAQAPNEIWLCDRQGYVLKKWPLRQGGQIRAVHWSHDGRMLAVEAFAEQDDLWVAYLDAAVMLPIARKLGGSGALWVEQDLYFLQQGKWYFTSAPRTWPVIVQNPVPQVVQRKRILSPTVIKEGDTIRLTRPSLSLP